MIGDDGLAQPVPKMLTLRAPFLHFFFSDGDRDTVTIWDRQQSRAWVAYTIEYLRRRHAEAMWESSASAQTLYPSVLVVDTVSADLLEAGRTLTGYPCRDISDIWVEATCLDVLNAVTPDVRAVLFDYYEMLKPYWNAEHYENL